MANKVFSKEIIKFFYVFILTEASSWSYYLSAKLGRHTVDVI